MITYLNKQHKVGTVLSEGSQWFVVASVTKTDSGLFVTILNRLSL